MDIADNRTTLFSERNWESCHGIIRIIFNLSYISGLSYCFFTQTKGTGGGLAELSVYLNYIHTLILFNVMAWLSGNVIELIAHC